MGIRNMKSALDMKSPEDQPHLTTYGRNYFAKKKQTTEAAFNDLKMIQAIAKTMTRPFPYEENKEATVPHSLENLKPTASVKKLEEDYRKNQKYVVNSSWTARRARLYDIVDEGPPMRGIPNSQSAPDLQDPYAGKLP